MLRQLMTVDFKGKQPAVMNDTFLYTDYLQHLKDFEEVIVEPDVAYKYQGNFYGLLTYLDIPKELFILTLYINKIVNPIDYRGEPGVIKVARELPIPRH